MKTPRPIGFATAFLIGLILGGVPLFCQETSGDVRGDPASTTINVREMLDRLVEQGGENSGEASTLVDRMLAAGLQVPAELITKPVPPNDPGAAQLRIADILFSSGDAAFWPEAHSWLDRAVQNEKAAALERQAEILANGSFGREASPASAIALLKRAIQIPGAREAYFHLGNIAARGVGMPQDGAMAIAYYREGAKAESLRCLIGLHQLYREGSVIEKDLAEAERFGKQAAEKGSAEACYQLGIFYERFAGGAPDWNEAAGWLEKASQLGHGGAATRLASYHYGGRLGDEPDPITSLIWCRKAAELGDAEACFMVSSFYAEGKAIPKDMVASSAWLRLGAQRGHIQSANQLGLRYLTGTGIEQSPVEAVRWFEIAANAGMPAAWLNLSELYLNGLGVQRDRLKAIQLLESAAKANNLQAQERLSRYLSQGASGQRDPVGAAYWAARMAKLDQKKGAELARQMEDALSESQKGELKRRLADYENRNLNQGRENGG